MDAQDDHAMGGEPFGNCSSSQNDLQARKSFRSRFPIFCYFLLGFIAISIAVPNIIGIKKGRDPAAPVKNGIRTIQIAAESCATDSGGTYGPLSKVLHYLPGGSNSLEGESAVWSDPNTELIEGSPVSELAAKHRLESPKEWFMYYQIIDDGNSYLITSTDKKGRVYARLSNGSIEF